LAIDKSGNLFVSNPVNSSGQGYIGEYTTDGAPVNTSLIRGLNSPAHIALDVSGYLYVTDYNNGTVGKYTTSGATVNAALISGLVQPTGLALDGQGHLFVASGGANGKIGEYTTDGQSINPSLITGLNYPEDMVFVVPEPSCTTLAVTGLVLFVFARKKPHLF
jgi:sugar lactone lactonase YvrE